MGYGAELWADAEADYFVEQSHLTDRVNRGDWQLKNGETINIRYMSNSYIINCIRMLEKRSGEWAELWSERFERELEFRAYIKSIVNGQLDC